jgi:8-oxo-dGTP pyrophosphatase MutT (NUDIX family)
MVYSGYRGLRGKIGQIIGEKPRPYEPTPEMIKEIEPYTRQRATLMLKDSKGRYILSKERGISIGGDIKRGETPRQAMLRELMEETGLSARDIQNLRFKKKIVTPEETFHVFTGTIRDVGKIRPMSDIAGGIRTVSPREARTWWGLGEQIRGQTGRYPRYRKGIRSYELGIISELETGKPIQWLKQETPMGEFFLGTQARYDVPYKYQRRYLKRRFSSQHHFIIILRR